METVVTAVRQAARVRDTREQYNMGLTAGTAWAKANPDVARHNTLALPPRSPKMFASGFRLGVAGVRNKMARAERTRLGDLELAVLNGTASDADKDEYRQLSDEHGRELLADLNRRLLKRGEPEVATWDDVVPGSAAWRVAFGEH